MITRDQLLRICPLAPVGAVQELNEILRATGCNTPLRAAMLIAQLSVESDQFRATVEYGGLLKPYAPFYGRGWMQITWKENYRQAGEAIGIDLVEEPDKALLFNAEICAWFWNTFNLNPLADEGNVDECTRVINGRRATEASLESRRHRYAMALEVLEEDFSDVVGGNSTKETE